MNLALLAAEAAEANTNPWAEVLAMAIVFGFLAFFIWRITR
ncbi:hypothetical protein [Nocardia sp. NPDC057455]